MTDHPAPLRELLYRTHSGWSRLPDWARFMLDAGARAVSARPAEGRLVIALSVPARGFAAALAGAAGAITAFLDDPPGNDDAEHFDYLSSLPGGTAISHRRRNSVEQGRFVGVEVGGDDGKPRVRVALRKEDILLPVNLCTRIQVIEDTGTLKATKQALVKDHPFLTRALPGVDVTSLSSTTRLDCVLIGVQHSIEAELTAREFGVGDGNRVYEGCLQGIVRARDVSGTRNPYRSAVIASSSEDGDVPVTASTPRLAVFDGARAFNQWRTRWRESNWLVLIDRGLPTAEDGASAINQGYATRLADSDVLGGIDLPRGIESLSWVERQ